jgi:hypothetical protein
MACVQTSAVGHLAMRSNGLDRLARWQIWISIERGDDWGRI